MSLLGNKPKSPAKKPLSQAERRAFADVDAAKFVLVRWPESRRPEGLGMSFRDGWNFGTGFGLALIVAVPVILIISLCVIAIALSMFGSVLAGMMGG